jgi:hypothetical protein
MKFIPGKLYFSTEHCLLFYSERELAISARRKSPKAAGFENLTGSHNKIILGFWKQRFGEDVSQMEIKQPFLYLKKDGRYVQVLVENKIGWIINESWLKIKDFRVPRQKT